jgi:uncharacterized membrane protein YphA (DoxX/SURF4 family)
MNSLQLYGLAAARVSVGVVFLTTGFGNIAQAPAAKALADHGAPGALVPLLILAARTIPATLVGHGFWQLRGTPTYIVAANLKRTVNAVKAVRFPDLMRNFAEFGLVIPVPREGRC